MNDVSLFLDKCAKLTEDWLRTNLKVYHPLISDFTACMRYSLFAGGKRIRPALMFASHSIFSDKYEIVTPFAASIEVLHTYSLIHDDLPAMDDDDLRRGRPTNHKVYGEAAAILAGDALLTKAFEFISNRSYSVDVSDKVRIDIINALSVAAGDCGMVGGQYVDIICEGKKIDYETLKFIHLHKTGALLKYSSSIGALLAGGTTQDYERLLKFGENVGLAFQIIDDILDVTATTEELGKDAHSDIENEKVTYPSLFGLEKSKAMANELVSQALELVSVYKDKSLMLQDIARLICKRKS